MLLALLATPALAEDRPLVSPSRDVDVVYVMAGPEAPLAQRLRWGVALGKLRVDPPSPGMFVIIDTASHVMQTVREGDRSVLEMPAGGVLPGAAPDAGFTRAGEAAFAGLSCTQWRTRDAAGREVLVCLTADGVLLRAEADGLVLLQAARVSFAPQPEQVFRVPPDYRKIISPPASAQRR